MEPVIAGQGIAAITGDAALIARARTGDTVAFEILITPRLDGLYRSAWAIVGNEPDARDATQDACLSAWRQLPRLRHVERFDAWLGRVLVNSCRMLLRRGRRVREIAIPTGYDVAAPGLGGLPSVDDAELVARAFDRLKPDARALLVLHHLRHEPLTQIAAGHPPAQHYGLIVRSNPRSNLRPAIGTGSRRLNQRPQVEREDHFDATFE